MTATHTRPSVRLATVTDQPIDRTTIEHLVADDRGGAVVSFAGVVRDHDQGRTVLAIEYVGHPSAQDVLNLAAAQIAEEPGVLAVAAVHRLGELSVGDVAVVTAVSCAHRAEAFAACARLIDVVKAKLPVWKRQVFHDGGEEWVACP